MLNKKLLLGFLSGIILLLLSGFVYAQDSCCVDRTLESCYQVDSEDQCQGDVDFHDSVLCSALTECDVGCCCGLTSNIAKKRFMCPETDTFVQDSSLTINQQCSCGGDTYTITGQITEKRPTGTNPASYAHVSADGSSVTADNNGEYALSDVLGGFNVLVSAEKNEDGCLPNSEQINLFSDTIVDIELNCECDVGDCDFVNNAYCQDDQWVCDNTYCSSYCAANDPDCLLPPRCVDNDGQCPLGCTSQTDSDCICSSVPNNVCPLGCTPTTDADCVSMADCGNGIVEYPYETCEKGTVSGGNSFCGGDDCVECNCIGLSACGNLIIEAGEDCEVGMVCPDGSPCDNCQCGDAPCEGDALNPSATASFDSQNKDVQVEWSISASCPLGTYYVYRCEKILGGEDCSSTDNDFTLRTLGGTLNQNWIDPNLPQTSEFCYYVEAIYIIGGEIFTGKSNIVCQKTGDEICMEDHPDEFCIDHVRSECDADNNIIPIHDCKLDGMVCMGPNSIEKTWCTDVKVCDLCNGLYGLFADPDLDLKVDGRFCYSGSGVWSVEGCYLDRTKAMFSAFDYCANVINCYDYKSKQTCEDTNDPCDKNQGCEWIDSNSPNTAFEGVGGICRPVAHELQQCELCDEPEYNWISPSCNQEVCELFGECYYQGAASDEPCTSRITATCWDYKNEIDCTGGRAVHVDAAYNNTGNRIGVTHSLTLSNDKLNLGKCYWHMGNEWCMRNADNYPEDNIGTYGEDCAPGDITCESDFESPVTEILHPYHQVISLRTGLPLYPADVNILFSTSDDVYNRDKITTYFCIAPKSNAQHCYPTQKVTSRGVYETTVTRSDVYTLGYYSEDFAKNLEQVKYMDIEVDVLPPVIDIIDPPNEDYFTAQSSVNIQAITSLDTRYICTYESGSNIKKCISNCVFTNQVPPCIDSITGEFNITVTVPSNEARGILFDAEDLAGNKVVGWSALAIYYNQTPIPAPTIIIEEARAS